MLKNPQHCLIVGQKLPVDEQVPNLVDTTDDNVIHDVGKADVHHCALHPLHK